MVSTYTTNLSLELPANGDYSNTWNVPVNADLTVLDTAIGGTTSLNATGASGTVALTTTQYRARIIKISGTLTNNVTYQVPNGVGGFWFVQNSTSGAFAVTLASGGGGTSLALPQGYTTPATSDGTNIAIGYSTPSIVAAAGSDTQVQYNASGSLGASSSFTWNYSTNTLSATNVNGTFTGNLTGNVTGNVSGTAANVTNTVAIANGGTGATTAAAARTSLGAAASGANTDITSLLTSTALTESGTITATTLGFRGIPQNAQGAAYVLVLADQGKHIAITTGGVTIPANASVPFPIGATAVVFNNSASPQTIAITSDTLRQAGTTNTGTRTLAAYGLATLVKTAATVWVVSGNVS